MIFLGRGTSGPNEGFQNDERWETGISTCYLGELVVGKE
jgi:hypothetical protein